MNSTGGQEASEGHPGEPERSQERSKRSQEAPKRSQKHPREPQEEPKRRPRGTKRRPRAATWHPRDAQEEPKGRLGGDLRRHNEAKVSQNGPQSYTSGDKGKKQGDKNANLENPQVFEGLLA